MTTHLEENGAIVARLDRLEKENRRWRLAALLCCGVAAVALFTGPAASQAGRTITAERFVVVDAAGKERAELAVEKDGSPALSLHDAAGRTRASLLSLGEDGSPGLRLSDAAGKVRAGLGSVEEDGSPALHLYDAAGKTRVWMGRRKDDSFGLGVNNSEGKVLYSRP